MKHREITKESISHLDNILKECGITTQDKSDYDGTIIGYDGNPISIDEALSLFPEDVT